MNPEPPIRKDLFGFTAIPFTNNFKKPYLDDQRKDVLNKLKSFLHYRGFAVLSGASGCGKSVLLNYLCQQLNLNAHKVVYIPFSILSENDMLKAICQRIDLQVLHNKAKMISSIQKRIQEIQPINPVFVIDEVQNINHNTLEIIRLITNFNFDFPSFISVIMAGTNEFIELLRLRIHEPLRQRVTLFTKLNPLPLNHLPLYINHHLSEAGAHQDLFPASAIQLIYDASGGIPRIIDHLALAALKEASFCQLNSISLDHIHKAIEQVILPEREIIP